MSDTAWERRGRPRAHSPLLIAGHWENLPFLFLPTQGSGSLEKEDSHKGQLWAHPFLRRRGDGFRRGSRRPIAPTHPCCYSPAIGTGHHRASGVPGDTSHVETLSLGWGVAQGM